MPMWKKFLTIKEAAEVIGVTPLTLRNWDRRGKLAAHRHPANNYRVYRMHDIQIFLKKIEKNRPRRLKIRLVEEEKGV